MKKIAPIHYKKLVKVFELAGFIKVREKGDHMVFVKDGILRPIIIPKYNEIPIFIIKTNLNTAHIDRILYFELLKKA